MINPTHRLLAKGREKKPKPTNFRISGTCYSIVSFLTNIISKLKGRFPCALAYNNSHKLTSIPKQMSDFSLIAPPWVYSQLNVPPNTKNPLNEYVTSK